jgi:carboxylesterase type B
MKEKVMDIRWVKKKIKKFGGDNGKVKIFG